MVFHEILGAWGCWRARKQVGAVVVAAQAAVP